MYNKGPYSPELANYYYEKLDMYRISADVKTGTWNSDNSFSYNFLALFGNKEPERLEVASTLIDSTNYFEDEQEILNKVYVMNSDYSKSYIDDVWKDLKNKSLVEYESGLKLNNLWSIFQSSFIRLCYLRIPLGFQAHLGRT